MAVLLSWEKAFSKTGSIRYRNSQAAKALESILPFAGLLRPDISSPEAKAIHTDHHFFDKISLFAAPPNIITLFWPANSATILKSLLTSHSQLWINQ